MPSKFVGLKRYSNYNYLSREAAEPQHYAFIDALRGWAFLAVFAFHTGKMVEGLPPLLADVLGRGWAGVQLFFVVSAFTLCRSLATRAADPVPLRAYFSRRAFRILPMFWVAIGLYLVVDGLGPRWGVPDGLEARHVALAALLLHGFDLHALNGVVPGGWSVATEVEFYLILPLMLGWASSLARALALWAGAVALSIAALPGLELLLAPFYSADQRDLVHEFAFYSLPVQLPVFAAGLILYRLLGPDRATLRRLEGWWPAPQRRAILIAVIVLVVGLPLHPVWPLQLAAGIPGHIGYGVLFVLLAYALATYPLSVLVNPVSRFLGRVSYSGYLLHFAVLAGVGRIMSPMVVEAWPLLHLAVLGSLALGGTTAAAAVTYALVEQPGIVFGRWSIAGFQLAPILLPKFPSSTRRRPSNLWTFPRPDAFRTAPRARTVTRRGERSDAPPQGVDRSSTALGSSVGRSPHRPKGGSVRDRSPQGGDACGAVHESPARRQRPIEGSDE